MVEEAMGQWYQGNELTVQLYDDDEAMFYRSNVFVSSRHRDLDFFAHALFKVDRAMHCAITL